MKCPIDSEHHDCVAIDLYRTWPNDYPYSPCVNCNQKRINELKNKIKNKNIDKELDMAEIIDEKQNRMHKREKVIKGLEYCKHTDGVECPNCPYWHEDDCVETLHSDTLALLKEQEAVEPVKQVEQNEWTVCSNCRNHLISKWIFCPYCGRSVKWNEP